MANNDTDTLQERVQRGAEWLDKQYPNWWAALITINGLNMHDECLCILGQLWGFYGMGELELVNSVDNDGLGTHEVASKYGFEVDKLRWLEDLEIYEDLDKAWIEVIKQRQGAVVQ